MSTAAVFLDTEKAFDTTWHLSLLYKLCTLQFSINLIKLIGSFLSQKEFRVSVEGKISTPWDIQAGVPQDSVLSHTLYSLYKMIRPKQVSLLMTPVYMRQTAKRVMFSESCSEVSVLLRCGVTAGT
jgi:hypothetical protein